MDTNLIDQQLTKELKNWVLLVENEAGIYELSQSIYAMAETKNERGESLTPPDDIIFTYDHGDDEDFFINNTGIDTYQKYLRVDKTGRNVLEVIEDHRTAVWVKRNIERFIKPLKEIIRLHYANKSNIIEVLDFHMPSSSEKVIIKFEELLEKYSPIDEDLSWANESINNDLFLDGFIRTWLIELYYDIGIVKLSSLVSDMARASINLNHNIYKAAMELTIFYDYGEDDNDEAPLYYNNTGINSAQQYIRLDESQEEIIEVIENLHVWFYDNSNKYIPVIKGILAHNADTPERILKYVRSPRVGNKLVEEFIQLFAIYMNPDLDLTWVNESGTPQTFTRTKIVDTILDWMDDQIVASNPARLFRTLTVLLETIQNYSVNYHFNGINWWYIRASDTTLKVSYEVADEKFSYVLPTNYESDDYESRKQYEMLVNLMYKDFINTAAPLLANKMYTLILDLCASGESLTNETLTSFAKQFNRNIPLAFTKLEFDVIRYKEDVSWLNESATSRELIAWMTGLNKRRIQK